ncbi:MAG: helix-hairpin-helix domain-containing protein [Lentisphaeria bacterium]|jgi:DNA uptake protein ComE-like DNA-binding protein|nr:helix-hairpin-helix domain-containing protein [Lentisphaeria bacterium]
MNNALSVCLRRLAALAVVAACLAAFGARAEEGKEEKAPETVVVQDEAALLAVVNQADVKTLTLLPGVGRSLAGSIVAARPFAKLDDLLKVKGIAAKRLEQIKGGIGKTKVPATVFAPPAPTAGE